MKKLISILLALVFVFSMATVAFADENTSTKPTDQATVNIEKVYTLVGAGTSPAETFTLEQVRSRVVDGEATSAPDLESITGASFAEGAATAAGAKANIVVTLPQYSSVGIYEYTLAEVTTEQTAGVDYRSENIKLVVTVVNDNGSKLRIAGVHTETEDGAAKSGSFGNTYSAGALKVMKTVEGNLGDRDKYFEFKVTLNGVQGKKYAESFAVGSTSYSRNPSSIGIGTETTFLLKHGETLTISNIPYGVSYTVSETVVEGYTTTKTGDTGTINAAEQTASFTNTKTGTVDTGISLDSVPFILILAVCAGAAVLFVTKRRSVEF